MGLKEIREIKAKAGLPKEKKRYTIPKKSAKKIAQENEEKKSRNGDDTILQKWFKLIRRKLTGTCQCGCGQKSQKDDELYFRNSCCHIFPKRDFPSVMYHPLNYVERRFWGGCHSIMDDTSMDRWSGMADWDDIKEKFYELAPLLTDEEKSKKFYTHLEKLIYQK